MNGAWPSLACNISVHQIEDPIGAGDGVECEKDVTEEATRALLHEFFAAESEVLLGTLRLYVVRAGLAAGQGVEAAAAELLGEVSVQALASAGRFRAGARPMPWILGIAANLIKRQQVERAKRAAREPLVGDLAGSAGDGLSEAELFDRLAAIAAGDAGSGLEVDEAVDEILGRVAADDARVIRLAVVHDLNGEELARALGVTPGAARVRLHRALGRLRAAWVDGEASRVGA